jgi:selenocysteine lyase/cysteine desulfurase
VHFVPHELANVSTLNCDFMATSAYKFYGPHVGMLNVKKELLAEIDFPKLLPSPDEGPERAETGTLNQEGIVGAGAAIEFLASLTQAETMRFQLAAVYDELHRRSIDLMRQLWSGLSSIPQVRLFGPPPEAPRTATVSFVVEGVASTAVAQQLAARGLYLSHGDFYAATVVERLGLKPEGLVRAGCACYTTKEEINRLIEGVAEIAR